MKQEIYDYEVLYFDKEYKTKIINYVVEKIVDNKNAETKFIFISELDKDNRAILDSITLPYAVVKNIRVLSFYLSDNFVVKRDDNIDVMKHTIYSRRNSYNRFFKVVGGGRKFI